MVGPAIIPIPYTIHTILPIEFTTLSLNIFSIVKEYSISIVPMYPIMSIIIYYCVKHFQHNPSSPNRLEHFGHISPLYDSKLGSPLYSHIRCLSND